MLDTDNIRIQCFSGKYFSTVQIRIKTLGTRITSGLSSIKQLLVPCATLAVVACWQFFYSPIVSWPQGLCKECSVFLVHGLLTYLLSTPVVFKIGKSPLDTSSAGDQALMCNYYLYIAFIYNNRY